METIKIVELLLIFLSLIVLPILLILLRLSEKKIIIVNELIKISEDTFNLLESLNSEIHKNLDNYRIYSNEFVSLFDEFSKFLDNYRKKYNLKRLNLYISMYNRFADLQEKITKK
jgi:hypothetical protein